MLKFITGKPLWMNALFAGILFLILLAFFMFSLNFITHHGETLTIPAVTGKSLPEASKILEDQGFEVQIQDSVYNDTAKPLSVLRQFPDADALVKVNRTVYLTISRAIPPEVEMPLLEGLSYRNAVVVLKQYGLKMGDTTYQPDFARNSVLEQRYNGQRIKPGTKIHMGSSIGLVLGTGLGLDDFPVPDLFGMTFSEAKFVIESNRLNLGGINVDPDVTDTLNAFVYRQSPERSGQDNQVNRIRAGQLMYLSLKATRPVRQPDSALIKAANEY